MNGLQIIALDLEGTLISNAVSQIARPGLSEFLEFCKCAVPRLVMFTSVYEGKFRDVARMLVDEGAAPEWFPGLEYIDWHGQHKDLRMIPGATIDRAVLVDDFEGYVLPGQESRWVPILSYASPYSDDDAELSRVRGELVQKWGCAV